MRLLEIVQALARLAWPVALSRLGIMGMSIVDVIVVGQLAPDELAWQALAWAPLGPALVGGIGLLTGVQVLSARAIGAGQPDQAGGAWRRGVLIALGVGTLVAGAIAIFGAPFLRFFGIAPALAEGAGGVMLILAISVPLHLVYVASTYFLEALQRPMASTIIMWAANIVNLVLNLLLVPEWGAAGSAAATVAARILLAGALVWWIWNLADAVKYGVRKRARAPSYPALLRIGIAAAVSQVAEAGAFSAMTVLAGRIGDAAVATYQILLQELALVFMVALGIATATAVLVADAMGRNDPRHAARIMWAGIGLNSSGMMIFGAIFLIFANSIGRIFTADVEIAAMVASLTALGAVVLLPDGGQVVAAQALRARGDNWFPTASHILAYVVVMPSLAIWWTEVQEGGVAGLMWAIFWASVLSFGVLCARIAMITRANTAAA